MYRQFNHFSTTRVTRLPGRCSSSSSSDNQGSKVPYSNHTANEELYGSTVCPESIATCHALAYIARSGWNALKQFTTLNGLCDDLQSETPSASRSACWKACLLFRDLDTARWASISTASRKTFSSLQSHFLRNINNPDEVESFDDPLSEDTNVSRTIRARLD